MLQTNSLRAEDARNIADNSSSSFLRKTVMSCIAVAAKNGNYGIEFNTSPYSDKDITDLTIFLVDLGYKLLHVVKPGGTTQNIFVSLQISWN